MHWMLMPLRRYAEFSGRSRRTEYWMWILFQFIVGIGFSIVLFAIGGSALLSGDPNALMAAGGLFIIVYFIYLLVSLAFLIPSIAVTVRRLHDTNRSGWWVLAPLAPYILMFVGGSMAAASPDSATLAGIIVLISGLAVLVLAIVLLVFMLLEGTRGPNHYGPDPKQAAPVDVFA